MITIKEARTKRELTDFMEFPLKLYCDSPYYVPDILMSQVADMDRAKNPAFDYCDAKCFLAYRNDAIVGRICAILNERANEKFGKKYMRFTHVDFIDDAEVADTLFAAVESWARSLGCTAMHGPLGFSDMDREGMLVEGFDRKSLFYTYYNYPYYMEHMARMGFEKQVDWVELRINLPQAPDERLEKLAAFVRERKHLHHENLGDKPIGKLLKDVFTLYNDTYKALFGVVPLTDEQTKKYASEFRPMVDKRTTSFVYTDDGELVAFGIACPALDDAMRANHGRTVPFGWIPLLKALKGKNDTIDLLLIAVRPDLQGTGVNAMILDDMQRKARLAGFRYAETGPMLELNHHVLSQWRHYDYEQHKRRRCFVKELEN